MSYESKEYVVNVEKINSEYVVVWLNLYKNPSHQYIYNNKQTLHDFFPYSYPVWSIKLVFCVQYIIRISNYMN